MRSIKMDNDMIGFALQTTLNATEGKLTLDVAAQIAKGELVALYGNSGAGKTSILRMLAGLMQVESGWIKIGETIWLDTQQRINRKVQQRQLGFIFQDYALFPNMTVRQNLNFALSKKQSTPLIEELLDVMDLQQLQHQKPDQLSGGQQQRVALARALVQQPKILLLDEPFSALDEAMRTKLQDYVLKVHQQYGLTTILVSHDRYEILKMANRILVLEQGRFVADAKPTNFFVTNTSLKIIAAEQHQLTLQLGNELFNVSLTAEQIQKLS